MTRLSRRSLIQVGAVAGGLAATNVLPTSAYAGAPAILTPLPADWFTDFGTNAEMHGDSVSWRDRHNDNGYFFDAVVRHPITVG